ncbi:MAG: TlyA family RNA methyltransferase [Lactobacillaceae bacterium]|jgi:23S rRNA (cytidine1920-2'-O)/16S rRNA (cytidine1409-2'-O)-methyltransferase|nr:TlyA family RNA methyltransferase [Lactobacillaceae bacterium]
MKIRLDNLLVQQKIFSSRTLAQKAIKNGSVFSNTEINKKQYLKASELVDDTSKFLIQNFDNHYISRGSYKLLKAIEIFDIDFKNKNVMDIGASTGGFSQVVLENGANFVYAIDVGHGQLDKLIADNYHVLNIENYNFKNANPKDFIDPKKMPSIAVVDVSFISLWHIFHALQTFSTIDIVVALIKPQFEVGKVHMKNGIVKDSELVLSKISELIQNIEEFGYFIHDLDVSPIKGGDGNVEFISLFRKNKDETVKIDLKKYIKEAYKEK